MISEKRNKINYLHNQIEKKKNYAKNYRVGRGGGLYGLGIGCIVYWCVSGALLFPLCMGFDCIGIWP